MEIISFRISVDCNKIIQFLHVNIRQKNVLVDGPDYLENIFAALLTLETFLKAFKNLRLQKHSKTIF